MVRSEWSKPVIADAFEAYDNVLERVLGYDTAFDLLGFEREAYRATLDYGCGPGKVAERLARVSGKPVVAVDASPRMIELAKSRRGHPLVDYRLVPERGGLTFQPDRSIDGALSCFVFGTIWEVEAIEAIFAEIARVLAPGAPFIVLVTHPDSIGVQFETFRIGAPGRRYDRGEPFVGALRVPGEAEELVVKGFYWPVAQYFELYARHGFVDVQLHAPTMGGIDPEVRRSLAAARGFDGWGAALRVPPFALFRGSRVA